VDSIAVTGAQRSINIWTTLAHSVRQVAGAGSAQSGRFLTAASADRHFIRGAVSGYSAGLRQVPAGIYLPAFSYRVTW